MNNEESKRIDEINLVQLLAGLFKKKFVFILFGIIGITIGSFYTLNKEPRYQTEFTVDIYHPIISNSYVFTKDIKSMLDISKLYGDQGVTPHLRFYNDSFVITTNNKNFKNEINKLFLESIEKKLDILVKTTAQLKTGTLDIMLKDAQLILPGINNELLILSLLEGDLNNFKKDVMNSVKINYGPTITKHPKLMKFALLGLLVGLIMAILYILLCMLYSLVKPSQ